MTVRAGQAFACALLATTVAFGAAVARAQDSSAAGTGDVTTVCDEAAAAAERQFGLPGGMLAAIGRIESGRWVASMRRNVSWPFAIDSSGYDIFPDSAAQAVSQVRSLQAQGLQSIDVGCFQINLLSHPAAFASLDEAFDPAANAAYASQFLLELRSRLGGWPAAVAAYHSGNADLGEPYRARVYAAWQNGGDESGASERGGGGTTLRDDPAREPVRIASQFAAATIGGYGPALHYSGVRIVVPSSASQRTASNRPAAAFVRPVPFGVPPASIMVATRPLARRGGFPVVITPTDSGKNG